LALFGIGGAICWTNIKGECIMGDTKKQVLLGFNPNDFFYYNAQETPTDAECVKLKDSVDLNQCKWIILLEMMINV
jgi:hypothetical protein